MGKRFSVLLSLVSLVGALFVLPFLFTTPPSVFAYCQGTGGGSSSTGCSCNNCDGHYTCQVYGSSVHEQWWTQWAPNGTPGANCTRYWADSTCSGFNEANQYCGAATCKPDGASCTAGTECCGKTCNASGQCASPCSGNENNKTACEANGGTWNTYNEVAWTDPADRKLENGQVCMYGTVGNCKANGCDQYQLAGCAANNCDYLPDSGAPAGAFSCSRCDCPPVEPPPDCEDLKSLTTYIGYGSNATAQNLINNGTCQGTSCSDFSSSCTGVVWRSQAIVNLPPSIGGQPINRLCTRANSNPNVNELTIKDVTNNVAFVNGGGIDDRVYTYSVASIGQNSPGEYIHIGSSRAKIAPYCEAQGSAVRFCLSDSSQQADNPYPLGDYINSTPPLTPPTVDRTSKGQMSNGTSFSWNHTVEENNLGLLVVGVSYRLPGSTGRVKYVRFDGVNLTLLPNSKANYSDVRLTEIWYLKQPPVKTSSLAVAFTVEPEEAAAGAVSYTGVNQTTPFANNTGYVATGRNTSATDISAITVPNTTLTQRVFAVISAQTPKPTLTQGNLLWSKTTNNNNINSQGAHRVGNDNAPQTISWTYGYNNARWAISAAAINAGATRVANTLYWSVPDWGNRCGGNQNRSRLVINPAYQGVGNGSNGSPALILTTKSKQFTPPALPPSDQVYSWRIDTSNDGGINWTQGPPGWTFVVQGQASAPNLRVTNFCVRTTGACAGTATGSPNQTAEVQVTVQNTGSSQVPVGTKISLYHNRPSGNTGLDCTSSKTNSVTVTNTPLAPGTSRVFTIPFTLPSALGTYTATALADSEPTNPNYCGLDESPNGASAECVAGDCSGSDNVPSPLTGTNVVTYTVTSPAYFQVNGGDLTSGNTISSSVPTSTYLIKN